MCFAGAVEESSRRKNFRKGRGSGEQLPRRDEYDYRELTGRWPVTRSQASRTAAFMCSHVD